MEDRAVWLIWARREGAKYEVMRMPREDALRCLECYKSLDGIFDLEMAYIPAVVVFMAETIDGARWIPGGVIKPALS